jgi:hypothetical protein
MQGRCAVGVFQVRGDALGQGVGESHRAAEPDDLVQDRREPVTSGRQLDAAACVGACVDQGYDDACGQRAHPVPKW